MFVFLEIATVITTTYIGYNYHLRWLQLPLWLVTTTTLVGYKIKDRLPEIGEPALHCLKTYE